MSSLNCHYCNAEIPVESYFCHKCTKQVRCLNSECGSVLHPDALCCNQCGQLINTTESANGMLNRFKRSVKQTGKSYEENIELSMSDTAITHIVPHLNLDSAPSFFSSPSSNNSETPIRRVKMTMTI